MRNRMKRNRMKKVIISIVLFSMLTGSFLLGMRVNSSNGSNGSNSQYIDVNKYTDTNKYIDKDSIEYKENYIDMREVTNIETTDSGIMLYLEDGSGYYWER